MLFQEATPFSIPWIVPGIFQVNSDEIVAAKPPFDAQEVQRGGSALELRRDMSSPCNQHREWSQTTTARVRPLSWGMCLGCLGSRAQNSSVSVDMDRHLLTHFWKLSGDTNPESCPRGGFPYAQLWGLLTAAKGCIKNLESISSFIQFPKRES